MSASILQNTKECFLCRLEAEENGIYIQFEDIHGHDEWMRAFGKNYI